MTKIEKMLKDKERIDNLIDLIRSSMAEVRELKQKHEFELGYRVSPEGILNAYREGDLAFNEAVSELKRLIYDKY